MSRDISKFLVIMCETCDEECNCHSVEDVKWLDEKPICRECYESLNEDCYFDNLDSIEVKLETTK